MKSPNDEDIHAFRALATEADTVKREMDSLVRRLAGARRSYAKNPSDDNQRKMQELEQEGVAGSARLDDILEKMTALLELTKGEIQTFGSETKRRGDTPPRYRRDQLTADQISSTGGNAKDLLAESLDGLLRLMPLSKLTEFRTLKPAPPWLKRTHGLLSIVKGVLPESEDPQIHRFAQALGECDSYLADSISYDMYAGATLIPQTARLASRVELISEIPGAMKRIRSLWHGASQDVDATIFELLVAAGCAAEGRSVEFLEPLGGKTPDLRCHDPFPLLIECKRKRVLTKYEVTEECAMRQIFEKLDVEARKIGMWGAFSLHLTVDSQAAPADEIVASLLRMRFAGGRGMHVSWPWGTATYTESARVANIGEYTRMYSPVMLNALFGWDSDLPAWDGLICRVGNYTDAEVDTAREPVGLIWVNDSEQAIKKRSWGPMSTLNEAIEQIWPGEFGIPYVAYHEGSREAIADMRTSNLAEWLKGCTHLASVRIPFGRIFRFYPRPLGHGAPDFIESSMHFTASYGDGELPRLFPGTVIADS